MVPRPDQLELLALGSDSKASAREDGGQGGNAMFGMIPQDHEL